MLRNMWRIRRAGLPVLLGAAAATAASGQAIDVSYDEPSLDRWFYPFNGTPGVRPFVSIFGATGEPDFDDRDGQMLLGFQTSADVPAGLDPSAYTVTSVVLTIMYDGQVSFVYDNTPDSYTAFLDPDDDEYVPDEDEGQPLELFGAGARNGFEVATFPENGPHGPIFGEGVRNIHALGFDGSGVPIDISNNVRDRFDPQVWAVGQAASLTPGAAVPFNTDFVFDVNVADPFVQGHLQQGLSEGHLTLIVTSLHMVAQQTGSFPTIYTKENPLVIDGLALPARLELSVTVDDAGNPADINGDGLVDVQDLVAVILAWGPCPPTCPEDVDGDGFVAVTDLVEVILNWT
jgi:hypothetical protein